MNLIIQYGLLGLVLGLGLGLGFILYCRNWRPWHYRTCAHSPLEACLSGMLQEPPILQLRQYRKVHTPLATPTSGARLLCHWSRRSWHAQADIVSLGGELYRRGRGAYYQPTSMHAHVSQYPSPVPRGGPRGPGASRQAPPPPSLQPPPVDGPWWATTESRQLMFGRARRYLRHVTVPKVSILYCIYTQVLLVFPLVGMVVRHVLSS